MQHIIVIHNGRAGKWDHLSTKMGTSNVQNERLTFTYILKYNAHINLPWVKRTVRNVVMSIPVA